LSKALGLKEVAGCAIGAAKPAAVRGGINEVKERQEAVELGVRLEDMATGVARDSVEHVDNVQE
jgi:hypothetical protein